MGQPILATNWTVVGVLLTALFTGGTLVIAVLAFQHGRQLAGHRKPVVSRIGVPVGLAPEHRPQWIDDNGEKVRVATVHLFNRSDRPQRVWISEKASRILWPPRAWNASFQHRQVLIDSGEGGHYPLFIMSDE